MNYSWLIGLVLGVAVGALISWLVGAASRRVAVAEAGRTADAARAASEAELVAARREGASAAAARDAETARAAMGKSEAVDHWPDRLAQVERR
ncbi:MAG: hypothetical protein ACRDQU_10020, partial [Pseudonocardiaceae bacterium]